jgi:hypothetical protein
VESSGVLALGLGPVDAGRATRWAWGEGGEGVAELTLEAHTAGRPETTGRMLQVVAGARFVGSEPRPGQGALRLPVVILGRAA